ncbi:helix-turn-helix domain-containing protein [Streptomyces sp. NPDC012600]|uniref:Transcriptional regulator n=2 Tax=Streptomyces TaxID=1883 RepID=A0ABU2W877_9ACTN|nr:helix-turn-helix domain-containing protein [Streptomyces griseus]MDT0494085.1 transcriptional regulator [Streptomyces griseus]
MMASEGIGALLRGIREAAGLTREEQAAVLQAAQGGKWFDPENLKRWETEKRLPTPMWHALLAECYGRSAEEIVRAVVVSRRRRRLHRLIDEGAREEGSAVDRRKFLGVAAATGMAGLPDIAEARQGINAGLSTSDSGDLAYLEGAFERHRGGYRGRPPNEVLGQMRADLDLLRELLSRPHPAAVRKELARTAAGITGLVAIVQHDRGDQRDAVGWFATAERAARESGDRHMLAWVLSRHAMVPLNYGAPHVAATMAIRARAEAGRLPSAAGALAAAVTARSLASVGDQEGALRAVADARAAAARLDAVQAADTWFGYPAQKHHVHLSQAFTLMGRTREAYTEQDSAWALTRSPSVMTRALIAVDRAACVRADGDPATAADLAVNAWVQLPAAYQDGLVRSRAESLCQSLPGRPGDTLRDALANP